MGVGDVQVAGDRSPVTRMGCEEKVASVAGPPSPRSPDPPPAMVVMTPVVRSTLRMRLLPTSEKYMAS